MTDKYLQVSLPICSYVLNLNELNFVTFYLHFYSNKYMYI